MYLSPQEVGLGGREAVSDVARVLSGYVDCIIARVFSHQHVEELARYAAVPVVNALTDYLHPCQAMADAMTVAEFGDRSRDRVVYVGDGNNVAHSLSHIAGCLGMRLTVCTPKDYGPDPRVLSVHADGL